MKRDDVKLCERCGGTGEEYRPDLRTDDGPWLDCLGCHGYAFEQSYESLRHACAILGESWRVGWPVAFRADVEYHDMCALAERDPALPFGWLLRETGSALVLPEETTRRGSIDSWRKIATESQHRVYWWDGTRLRQVDADTFADRLAVAVEHAARRALRKAA